MDIKLIEALAEILSEHGLSSVEISEGETYIHLEKESCRSCLYSNFGSGSGLASGSGSALDPGSGSATDPGSDSATDPGSDSGFRSFLGSAPGNHSVNFNHLIEVKSPLVGVFYSAVSPESDPFVSIGSKVKKGDVLCVIETMKLMNEIIAEQDGEIVDICVRNGDIAEYGQTLFKMY
ncbi:MAG: acetyl-CoA carboxylase, biotin carboxyl carrier protein [Peptococcaceae bacterium]|nr:acetyl-CoA carboxylase, biotin carboxyl carrier protein [Peptococcaceae bacterium]